MHILKEKTEIIQKQEVKIEVLESVVHKPVMVYANANANANVNVDISVKDNTQLLIKFLEKAGAFENKKIEKPPETLTPESIKKWLDQIKDVISISKDIGSEIKSYLPMIMMILSHLK